MTAPTTTVTSLSFKQTLKYQLLRKELKQLSQLHKYIKKYW
jgi:hypothetical protein